MSKLFIDCGTNLGQGLRQINKSLNFINNSDWIIHCFEPNPNIDLSKELSDISNKIIHKEAVFTENTLLKFRSQNTNGGGSRLEDINKLCDPTNVKLEFFEVQTCDFTDFFADQVEKYKEIHVKLDIEGAEYPVLNKMKSLGLLKYIDTLYLEQHYRFNYLRDEWENNSFSAVSRQISDYERTYLDDLRKDIKHVIRWD